MGKRTDIHKVLIIGSGPIIIGQACEFDYSGTQACKALRKLGYEIVLVNSNPATIMTDPETADVTYIEPLNVERLEQIIAKERPDALLPNLGGQSGLNLCSELAQAGILDKYNVKVIGVQVDAIERGEDRIEFKKSMDALGIDMARSQVAYSVEEGLAIADELGYPVVLRPAYTMGGAGGGLVYNKEELKTVMARGLQASLVGQVLVEESILGWEELELEVVRDEDGNMITVCFIENIDPLGVHTGDSFCSAPMLTISEEVQKRLQEKSHKVVDSVKVIGGCNVQWAHDPKTDRDIIIEINPRTSRSSALASKATGFPIALISAMLASGLTLNEIPCGKHGTLDKYVAGGDYVVLKFARWAFEKFKGVKDELGTQMRAVGEVMSIGNSFEAAMMKAVSSIELGMDTLTHKPFEELTDDEIVAHLHVQDAERVFCVYEALKRGIDHETIYRITKIDWWFLDKMQHLADLEKGLAKCNGVLSLEQYQTAKKYGFQDKTIKRLAQVDVLPVENYRAGFKMVDTCAAEFSANTPYFYSTYDGDNEAAEFIAEKEAKAAEKGEPRKKKVLVFGSGPIRIGQGIEFDYCSVHCVWTLKNHGCEAILVNNNPETVSTDFDTGDRLYFDPLNPESVDNIIATEKPDACVVQFGGQTAIKLAKHMDEIGLPILGTPADAIDEAEDRERFDELLERCNIPRAPGRTVFNLEEALAAADEIGLPVLMRPSYVLGGQNMIVAYTKADVIEYMGVITEHVDMDHPVLLDKYIMGTECEVDAICDGENFLIPGIMEQVERTGVHSGDSICVYPAQHLTQAEIDTIVDYTGRFARELKVVGLVNVQYAVQNDRVYVIEVNPRSSRTVPYISKVTGVPMVDLAVRCTLGEKLKDMGYGTGLWRNGKSPYYAVKVPVYSFLKLHGVDTMLGPEMKSTGEVLGIAPSFHEAMMKVIAGPEKKSRVVTPHAKRLTAYHEAGHAVVIHELETQDPVHQITIIPRGGAGGMTISLPQEDRSYMSRRELEEHIAVCLGGRVAEQLVLGDISTGASSDIQKASSIARNMVTKYGMSEKLGTIAYTSESNEVFIGRTMAQSRSYSEEIAGLIDEEVKSIVDAAYRRCEDILSQHRSQLELTAQYLLAHEVMSGETFQKVFTAPDDEVFEGLIPAES